MQPMVGSAFWFERRLDGLRDHRALGRPVRFYFRRREQVLYLVVGGWNTVFGYAVWAIDAVPARRLPALPRRRGAVVADRRAQRLPRLSLHRVPQPGLGDQGAASLLRRLLSDAPGEPRAAASRRCRYCRSASMGSRRCSPGSSSSCSYSGPPVLQLLAAGDPQTRGTPPHSMAIPMETIKEADARWPKETKQCPC